MDIPALIRERGLENEVSVPARELQRLLDLERSYDWVMGKVQHIADHEFTRETFEQWDVDRKKKEEDGVRLSDLDAMGHLTFLCGAVESARELTDQHPSVFNWTRNPEWKK